MEKNHESRDDLGSRSMKKMIKLAVRTRLPNDSISCLTCVLGISLPNPSPGILVAFCCCDKTLPRAT